MDSEDVTTQNTTRLIVLIISTLGIVLIALALFLLILTAVLFAEWRRNYKNQLLIQFIIARFLYAITRYALDNSRPFTPIELYDTENGLFYFISYAFYFTEAAVVAWMFVFTKHMYDCLAKVFVFKDKSIWAVSVAAWVIPVFTSVILILALIILRMRSVIIIYSIYIFALKWPVIIINGILLVLIIKSILVTNKSNTESNTRIVVVMIMLILNLCVLEIITDIFRLYFSRKYYSEIRKVVDVYNLFLLYQCAFSTFFWVYGNARTRKLWRFEGKDEVTARPQIRSSEIPKPAVAPRPMSDAIGRRPNTLDSYNPSLQKQLSSVI